MTNTPSGRLNLIITSVVSAILLVNIIKVFAKADILLLFPI